jgi:hypothetical protein
VVTAPPLKVIEGEEETAQSFSSILNGVPLEVLPAVPNVLLLTVPKFTVPEVVELPATLLIVQAAAETTPLKLIVPSEASALADMPKDKAIKAILVGNLLIFISYVINVKFI